ncbi:hypothetical protein [Rhizobium laguerreae]|uniref:hypothetical protein n=1 Tax=Rhizobium laguerreae TaxID=1076926 RepID=UPI001C90FBC1|nr:hypothetical protein [Rhizobium laguerreae]MBY3434862.1 hypothetical protein [Rhizobium laguerreae]MBY3449004.1 hypothetical protein [Rhizobium laguerreae]MBY3456778.1 hypothetical protein [Rhizobium laguerreae]
MAKIGNNYEAEYENTEKQGGGGGILPHMYAQLQAESINLPETKDKKGFQAEITFEVIAPEEFKGRKFWAYWTIVHSDGYQHGAYKYGKPMFDRFGRAVGEEITADTDTDDLLFKSFVAEVGIQVGNANPAGGFYKNKNQIERFFYEDANAKEPVPELGVIGDGTQGKKLNEDRPAPAPANDNRPAAAAKPGAAAAPAGRRPWGAK